MCQPEGDTSIMFIHRPIWQKLTSQYKELAAEVYKRYLDETNHFAKSLHKRLAKLDTLKDLAYLKKIPSFTVESCCFSQQLLAFAEGNYIPKIKKALLELLAFDMSCTATHTIYQTTYTISEQISDWTFEVEWYERFD